MTREVAAYCLGRIFRGFSIGSMDTIVSEGSLQDAREFVAVTPMDITTRAFVPALESVSQALSVLPGAV